MPTRTISRSSPGRKAPIAALQAKRTFPENLNETQLQALLALCSHGRANLRQNAHQPSDWTFKDGSVVPLIVMAVLRKGGYASRDASRKLMVPTAAGRAFTRAHEQVPKWNPPKKPPEDTRIVLIECKGPKPNVWPGWYENGIWTFYDKSITHSVVSWAELPAGREG
jgi:hypothetical protein